GVGLVDHQSFHVAVGGVEVAVAVVVHRVVVGARLQRPAGLGVGAHGLGVGVDLRVHVGAAGLQPRLLAVLLPEGVRHRAGDGERLVRAGHRGVVLDAGAQVLLSVGGRAGSVVFPFTTLFRSGVGLVDHQSFHVAVGGVEVAVAVVVHRVVVG